MSSDEILTGADSANALVGYERRESAEPEAPKTFGPGDAGITEAANAVSEARRNAVGGETEPDKIYFTADEEGDKKWQTAEEAGRSLSDFHAKQRASEAAPVLDELANQVDEARNLLYGSGQQPTTDAAQPTAEAPQAETPPEGPAPEGIDPDIAAALQNPKIRAFAEQQLGQLSAAEKAYTDGLAHNAAVTASYILAQFEEFKGLDLNEAAQRLAMLDRQSPERAFAIRQQLNAPATMLAEAQRIQQANLARQQHEAAQRLHAFREEQDRKILKTRPELADKAVAKKYMDAAPTYLAERGFSRNDLEALITGRSGVAIFDARMQDILIDAIRYREAMQGIAHPPAKPIPQVQRPGNGTSRAERSAAQVGELRQRMKDSSGNKQIEAAVRYLQAKRARG